MICSHCMFRGSVKLVTNFNPTILNDPWPCTEQFDVVAEPTNVQKYMKVYYKHSVPATRPSQWPLCLRRGSATARLLGLRVRIPPMRGCLSLIGAVCCQVAVSASGWSLVQRSPTECSVSECDREASIMRSLSSLGLLRHEKCTSYMFRPLMYSNFVTLLPEDGHMSGRSM